MKARLWNNPTSKRSRFLVLLVPLLLGAACDPQGPGAMGQLTVSPEVTLEAAGTLEIRFAPDDGNAFDPGSTNLSDENSDRRVSWNLAEIEFPFSYHVGGGLGTTEHEHWRVVAWIAKSSDVDRPMPGEVYGTRVFDVEDCGLVFSKYCGVMSDIDLEIDISRPGGSSGGRVTQLQAPQTMEGRWADAVQGCSLLSRDATTVGCYRVELDMGYVEDWLELVPVGGSESGVRLHLYSGHSGMEFDPETVDPDGLRTANRLLREGGFVNTGSVLDEAAIARRVAVEGRELVVRFENEEARAPLPPFPPDLIVAGFSGDPFECLAWIPVQATVFDRQAIAAVRLEIDWSWTQDPSSRCYHELGADEEPFNEEAVGPGTGSYLVLAADAAPASL